MVLDCKTRWSSLVIMLERTIEIKLPIQKALLDLGEDIYLSDQEIAVISSIVEALNAIKIALEQWFSNWGPRSFWDREAISDGPRGECQIKHGGCNFLFYIIGSLSVLIIP